MVKHDLPIPTTFSSQHAIGNMQNMMSTILNLYSWVSYFSGNLHTQKTNKAHKKWANITRIYHFAHTNRWNQLHIILYPIFILIPQNYSNFNFCLYQHQSMPPTHIGGACASNPTAATDNPAYNKMWRGWLFCLPFLFRRRICICCLYLIISAAPLQETYIYPFFGYNHLCYVGSVTLF